MNCITRSAAIAPGAPRRLWMRALVAWLRLGSLTDQVSSARVRLATPASASEAGDFGRPPLRELPHRSGHMVDK